MHGTPGRLFTEADLSTATAMDNDGDALVMAAAAAAERVQRYWGVYSH